MPPLLRGGLAVLLALALVWLVPAIGLDSRDAERAVLALIAFGVATAGAAARDAVPGARHRPRRERPRARGARAPRRRVGCAIELGVALDLMLIAVVAVVFHERIFAEFGAGDTAALRSLRD